jgi:predicted transcriptional regulator
MSVKIHPDGTVELADEEDIRLYKLYQAISGNSGPVATPVVSTPVNEHLKTTAAAAPSHKTVKTIKVNRDQYSILNTIKDLEPEAPGRKEIADLLDMDPATVSVQLNELKRIGLLTNGAPPNTWKWRRTQLAQNVHWKERG